MSEKKKSEGRVKSQESRIKTKEEETSAMDIPQSHLEETSAIDTPHSALKELPTAPDSYRDLKLQTEQMEVHHHPQLDHNPKPWKEYLLEGLMIFLAVTMGFFAENLRERISDSNRGKEFAHALYSELSADSVVAAHNLQLRIAKAKDLDYLYAYFKDSSLTALPRQFYPAFANGLYLINSYAFEPKDGVLSQLRSSGSERYFKSVALQKLLGDLSLSISNLRYRNEQEYQFFASPIKAFLLKYFDFNWLNKLRQEETSNTILLQLNAYRQSNREIKGNILNVASMDRVEASNMAIFYKQMLLSTQTLQLNNYIVANRKVLEFLRKNYDLQNE
jgi:hypothetical protein